MCIRDRIYDTPESEVFVFGMIFMRMLIGQIVLKRPENLSDIQSGNCLKLIPSNLKLGDASLRLIQAMLKTKPEDRIQWEILFEIFDVPLKKATIEEIKAKIIARKVVVDKGVSEREGNRKTNYKEIEALPSHNKLAWARETMQRLFYFKYLAFNLSLIHI
eukprot:TRINITY_DN20600_c0_g1_i1.p2 TRINITY_DN20600_c0_g1~~TRINITY_DN20600_c0_g1_i1.p2  ORF type:complete len:173 (-),score=35.27 TRINITY_DN20600_c0_g1_i1:23-505(-)